MFVNTTLIIGLIFLIPSLILFFYPYNAYDEYKVFGILCAAGLLFCCVIVTTIRLCDDRYSKQRIDLSSLIEFKKEHTTSAVYSKLIAD